MPEYSKKEFAHNVETTHAYPLMMIQLYVLDASIINHVFAVEEEIEP